MPLRRVDLIVASVAFAFLAALTIVGVVSARDAERRTKSQNNLRQIGRAFQAHVTAFGFFPGNGGPPMEVPTTPDVRTGFPDSEAFRWGYGDPRRAGRLQTGCWAYALLPYLGEEEAFRKQDHTRAVPTYYMGDRRPAKPQQVPKKDPVYDGWSYQDAGLGPWGRTDYAANDQVVLGGMGNVLKPDQVSDGLAETFLVGEKAMDTRAVKTGGWYWDEPIILGGSGGTGRKGPQLLRDADNHGEKVADNWGSPAAEGVLFLFADGHVQLFAYNSPTKLIAALISPRGGETVNLD